MCLLHTKPLSTEFDYNDVADFYSRNSDGLGVMWIEGGAVQVKKFVPKSAAEAWDFYKSYIEGKECVVHWRMRTAGDINNNNAHPYEVVPGVWLMHNGVLHTGNAQDKSRSDTDLYCENFLAPLLRADPKLFYEQSLQTLIASHIGRGNKFAIMDKDGCVIINEQEFVEYRGAKMSNTYAWSAPRVASTHQVWAGFYDEDEWVTPPIQTEADLDIELAVEFFYEVIENAGLWEVLSRVRMQEVEAAVAYVGVDDFYTFCDYIFDMALPDAVVIDYIKHPEDIPEFDLAEAA